MHSVRTRLTLLYGGLFLLSGSALIALVYVLANHTFVVTPPVPPIPELPGPLRIPPPAPPVLDPALQGHLDRQRAADLNQLLTSSVTALGVVAITSMVLGWIVAGRALHPLQEMTTTVRAITADRLDRRLAARGPDDELKRLADTFDDLLDRVEVAFDAQRLFVANASHELRTPLALQRATVELALTDPDPDPAALRAALEKVLAVGIDQERLITAMLVLARGQRSLVEVSALDLAAHTASVLDRRSDTDVDFCADLRPAVTAGDPALVEQLIANLVENAVRHNTPNGWVRVSTWSLADAAVIEVANSGPVVAGGDVAKMVLPFRRLAGDRTGSGHGLGLAIVAAVARTHGAQLRIEPLDAGGLGVTIVFPNRMQS